MTGEEGSKLAPPAKYSGELGLCRTFLIDCSVHFELTPHAFPTDRSKIAFMVSHMTGRAKAWASAEWAQNSPICSSLTNFEDALNKTFDPVTTNWEKAQELSGLRQDKDTVCDYAICFRTLAAESGWNNTALYDVFLKGAGSSYSRLPHSIDLPKDLDSFIALAIRTDNRMSQLKQQQRRDYVTREKTPHLQSPGWPSPCHSTLDQRRHPTPEEEGEPMQLGRTRLTQEE